MENLTETDRAMSSTKKGRISKDTPIMPALPFHANALRAVPSHAQPRLHCFVASLHSQPRSGNYTTGRSMPAVPLSSRAWSQHALPRSSRCSPAVPLHAAHSVQGKFVKGKYAY